MERLENLTLETLETAKTNVVKEGYSETQSIENIPVGTCSANTVLVTIQKKKVPVFSIIKFVRDEKDNEGNLTGKKVNLLFEAVRLNVLHVSTGKKFNNIDAKVTEDLKTALSKPENYTKELVFNSEGYVDGQKRQRTILKFESMSK